MEDFLLGILYELDQWFKATIYLHRNVDKICKNTSLNIIDIIVKKLVCDNSEAVYHTLVSIMSITQTLLENYT